MAALRLRKCPVFYIFALERARGIQESRSREPITRNGSRKRKGEKDTQTSGPIFFLLKRSRRPFVPLSVRCREVAYLARRILVCVSKRDTRSPYRPRRDALRNGDKVCNDDYFEEMFPRSTHFTEKTHTCTNLQRRAPVHACMKEDLRTRARNHNFGRFRSAPFLPTVLSLRVVGQITGFRCTRARGTLFGGANSERRRQRKRVRKDTECRKEDERRNKAERERERERS